MMILFRLPVNTKAYHGKSSKRKSWMTQGLFKSCKMKNALYLKFIKNPNERNQNICVTYRNKFKAIRIQAERNYYAAEFCKHDNNLKKTWSIYCVNSLRRVGPYHRLIISGHSMRQLKPYS